MKNQSYFLLLLGVLFILGSCTTVSRTKNAHLLGVDEKGVIAFSGAADLNIKLNDEDDQPRSYNLFQFQAAYSPIKHLVLSTSNSFLIPNDKLNYRFKGYDVDFAVGTYKKFKQIDSENGGYEYFLFDAYLSFGHSQTKYDHLFINRSNYTDKNKYALQLGVHYNSYSGSTKNQFFKIGFVYRPILLEYRKIYWGGEVNYFDELYLERVTNENTSLTHNVNLRAEFGVHSFRVFLNRGNTVMLKNGLNFSNRTTQVGMLFYLNRFAQKKVD